MGISHCFESSPIFMVVPVFWVDRGSINPVVGFRVKRVLIIRYSLGD